MNVRKEKLEKAFVALLLELSPERQYMRLFKEIVCHVWKSRMATSTAIVAAAKAKLMSLKERKSALVELLVQGRLDLETYEEELLRLKALIEASEQELFDADVECVDVEPVLDFAEKLVTRPDQLWRRSSLEQKQRLQRVFFPDGVTFTSKGFGTAVSSGLLKLLWDVVEGKATLAFPTGFESVLSP